MSANSRKPSTPSTERQALSFLHQAREVRDLDSAQVERIARRLRKPSLRTRQSMLWPALAAMTLFLVAGAAIAVAQGGLGALPFVGTFVGSLFHSQPHPAPSVDPRPRRATPKDNAGEARRGPSPESAVPTPMPPKSPGEPPARIETTREAVPQVSPRHETTRALALREPALHRKNDDQHTSPARESKPSPAHPEDPIVAESRSFAAVIEAWHRRHDSPFALALLDVHERRYPAGHMRLETRVLRAELYLSQNRNADALAVLDGLSLSGLPRQRELQTVRGELRAKAGRCAEARADLTAVLEKDLTDALARRASQSLSHCP
jgi:hypothetical protein